MLKQEQGGIGPATKKPDKTQLATTDETGRDTVATLDRLYL